MKKIIHISFIFFFVIITLGFTVNKHYSGGELFSFAIFSDPESCCEDVCNCCDEESETVQFLVDYTFSLDSFDTNQVEIKLYTATLFLTISEPELSLKISEFIDQDLPPPDNLTRLSYNQAFLL